jgi:hypothetical protein
MTRLEKQLLLDLTGTLYTSKNSREWVRLSALGLVERESGEPLHVHRVYRTEKGHNVAAALEARARACHQ